MRKALSLLSCVLLVLGGACGGGSSTPTQTSTPAPPPTPVPTHAGTYTGTMLVNIAQLAALNMSGSTAIAHGAGASFIDFGDLQLQSTLVGPSSWQLGRANLTPDDRFTGTNVYASAGCGDVTVNTSGFFSGNAINLSVTLLPSGHASGCDRWEMRGELRR